MADAIKAGFCPFCPVGPWVSPLNHIAKKHGVDALTMRDMAGLRVKDSVAAQEFSDRVSESNRARGEGGYKGPQGPHRITAARRRLASDPDWRQHLADISPMGNASRWAKR
jgi:hypothetical protein